MECHTRLKLPRITVFDIYDVSLTPPLRKADSNGVTNTVQRIFAKSGLFDQLAGRLSHFPRCRPGLNSPLIKSAPSDSLVP